MTDTSLKNSKGSYNQEQHSINKQFNHNSWKYKCISENTAFPCRGINMPMMTNGYNNNILTNNASDIESQLFGIGSTNLVKPKKQVKPDFNCIDNIKFFNTLETVMPNPLIIENNQRPKGPFC
tara:strand:- start:13586 stop:13954 length:369 start_codon:yes stop_codon:yes gene_type:complete